MAPTLSTRRQLLELLRSKVLSPAAQVLAHSIVWIQNGADTIVYANSTGTAENQGSANMQIILANVTASTLAGTDFFHF
jgi:hypothetical protein